MARHTTRVALDTAGRAYRWYLIWISKFAPGQERVKINEVTMYK